MILKASMENGSSSVGWRTTGFLGLEVDALDRAAVGGRRQVVDDGVEQRLHALVLEGRAAQHRMEGARLHGLAHQAAQGRLVRLVAVEVGGHRLVVELDGGLDQLGAVLDGLVRAGRPGSRSRRTWRRAPRPTRRRAFILIRSTTPWKFDSRRRSAAAGRPACRRRGR